MRCRHVQERLTLYLLDEVEAPARAQVEDHLAACPTCRAERDRAAAFLAVLDQALASVPAPNTVEPRVMATVSATPPPSRVRRADVPPVPVAADEAEHHMRRRTTAQLIAAAAVLLIVAVLWLVSPRGPRAIGGRVEVQKLAYELTVYNDDLALVRDLRRMTNLAAGTNEVRFDDVPTHIDPSSVTFRSTTDPAGTHVLEQNYDYDLATPDRVLSKYVDRTVECVTRDGVTRTGHLASHDADQVVLTEKPGGGKTEMLSRREVTAVHLEALPEGLLTRPTLVWEVHAEKAGAHETTVSYLTGGMKWHCNYVLVKRPGKGTGYPDEKVPGPFSGGLADLKAWVTIKNRSGASYPQAKLKLMAGDVHRVEPEIEQTLSVDPAKPGNGGGAGGFTAKAFFEYHLYTLGRKTDLKNNSTKQIELSNAQGIGTTTQYLFAGGAKVAVYLKFRNEEGNGLGMPLPKGIVRVMQEDTDGSLEFMGEDEIDHTPKDEEVKVLTGYAFDLVGKRRVVSDRRVGRSRRATIEVRLRTNKAAPVTITVRERIANNWRITQKTHDFRKEDAHTVEFDVPVAPNKESVLTFSYEATW